MIFDKTKELLKEFNGEEYENTIVNNMQYAIESKNLIKQSLQNKGSEITDKTVFRDYYKEIDKLNEWQSQLDWWDIKKIIQEDTEDYPAKAIFLLSDLMPSEKFSFDLEHNYIVKIKTSDGVEYTSSSTHTWDLSQDKECSKGYKTRYIIVYFSQRECNINYNLIDVNLKNELLYAVFLNANCEINLGSGSCFMQSAALKLIDNINSKLIIPSNNVFSGCVSLQKLSEIIMRNNNLKFSELYNLKEMSITLESPDKNKLDGDNILYSMTKLENVDFLENITFSNFKSALQYCRSLKKIPYIDISEVTDCSSSLFQLGVLEKIEALDFNSNTNFSNFLQGAYNLREIKKISNIKASGFSLYSSQLVSHDTLLRVLNALYDYSSEEETVYRITLGSTNLKKLTDEEKQIATDKGWTLS